MTGGRGFPPWVGPRIHSSLRVRDKVIDDEVEEGSGRRNQGWKGLQLGLRPKRKNRNDGVGVSTVVTEKHLKAEQNAKREKSYKDVVLTRLEWLEGPEALVKEVRGVKVISFPTKDMED